MSGNEYKGKMGTLTAETKCECMKKKKNSLQIMARKANTVRNKNP